MALSFSGSVLAVLTSFQNLNWHAVVRMAPQFPLPLRPPMRSCAHACANARAWAKVTLAPSVVFASTWQIWLFGAGAF
eukprot:13686014-Alexandrium_andersonii.AAC.1